MALSWPQRPSDHQCSSTGVCGLSPLIINLLIDGNGVGPLALETALSVWQEVLPITRVKSPNQAHIQILQRRPPRRRIGSQWRASNGRSRLQVVEVQRRGQWRLEPRVEVLVSPELRASVLEATAVHELGHAFGIWGHSPLPDDVMAIHQNQNPVLKLSNRDRVTLNWLYQQTTDFGQLIKTNPK